MKWGDSLLIKFKNEPDWGYEGLRFFFEENGVKSQDTFKETLGQFTRNYTQTTKRGLLTTNKG